MLAETFEAEVSGVYAVTPSIFRYPMALEGGAMVAGDLADLDDQSRSEAYAVFKAASAGQRRLSWGGDTSGDALGSFTRRALYCDLMVLGQRDPSDPASSDTPPEFLADLLAQSGKPALLIPRAGAIRPIGQTVLIAWKPTREAAHAVAAALPLLARAGQVHAVCASESAASELRALRHHLDMHGIKLACHPLSEIDGNAGEPLLSLADELGADLLVMGCYGHSRAREWVLGGVSRTVLQSMTLPVLMTH
jgi:nucleotide-binding universal stress UspA family protein